MANIPPSTNDQDDLDCEFDDEALDFNEFDSDEFPNDIEAFDPLDEDKHALAIEIENETALEETRLKTGGNFFLPYHSNGVQNSGDSVNCTPIEVCTPGVNYPENMWGNGIKMPNGEVCFNRINIANFPQMVRPPMLPHPQIGNFQNFCKSKYLSDPSLPRGTFPNGMHPIQPGDRFDFSNKTKRMHPQYHIKKPLNAFMLYMRDVRPDVLKQVPHKDSTTINQMIGKMWQGLSKTEQALYFEKAKEERERHKLMYPEYNPRDYYAYNLKKRRRKRDKNGNEPLPKKCRARFGVEQQDKWCKHCKFEFLNFRRKKKCLRFIQETDGVDPEFNENFETVSENGQQHPLKT